MHFVFLREALLKNGEHQEISKDRNVQREDRVKKETANAGPSQVVLKDGEVVLLFLQLLPLLRAEMHQQLAAF
jgi:hypothetical protein